MWTENWLMGDRIREMFGWQGGTKVVAQIRGTIRAEGRAVNLFRRKAPDDRAVGGWVRGWIKTMAPGFELTYNRVGDTVKVVSRAPVVRRVTQIPLM